jgi:hypothetical protein
MDAKEQEVLDIITILEALSMLPTWRMIYRRFPGDDFQLREILVSLIWQGKITESIVDANTVYHSV